MSRFDADFDDALGRAAAQNRRRVLRLVQPLDGGRVRLAGRELIDFSSNDYLGQSRDRSIRAGWRDRPR